MSHSDHRRSSTGSATSDESSRADGISRRDFIHDVTLSSLALTLPGAAQAAAGRNTGTDTQSPSIDDEGTAPMQGVSDNYPPVRTGLRGAHPGSFEVAHALAREGRQFDAPRAVDEDYDLIVVGGGISGLSAAYFYRQQHDPDARILILDNHDDFGGHAKRNEFHQGGPMRLVWGGTVNIEYPNYSPEGLALLSELGISEARLLENFEYNWRDSGTRLDAACWFDADTYGRDELVRGLSFLSFERQAVLDAIPRLPLGRDARTALQRFMASTQKVLTDLSPEELADYTRQTRYADFLRTQAGLPAEAIQIFSRATGGIWGVRAEDLSVDECFYQGLPGAHILNIPAPPDWDNENPAAMFPDGNASIARLLVRSLIPGSFPDMQPEDDPMDIVTASLDYARLDTVDARVRLRLSSTVVRAKHTASRAAVDVSYVQAGEVYQVRGRHCVMACYNRIIPHLCPELPDAQKRGLRQCVKRPMLVINVLLKDGKAIQRSGIASAYLPGSMLQLVCLVTGINTGRYTSEWDPTAPCVLQFFASMGPENADGMSITEQDQAGRLRLLQMRFEDFEAEVQRVLRGVWGPSDLVPERDITAITVNRWPHGYARDLLDFEDPAWLAKPGPYEIGRQAFGRITIANSDAGADAYTHTAIDQAWRAVNELPTEG